MRLAISHGIRSNHLFTDWKSMKSSFKKKEESWKKQNRKNSKNLGKNKKRKKWQEFLRKKDSQL
jgi:hypothetical protein